MMHTIGGLLAAVVGIAIAHFGAWQPWFAVARRRSAARSASRTNFNLVAFEMYASAMSAWRIELCVVGALCQDQSSSHDGTSVPSNAVGS